MVSSLAVCHNRRIHSHRVFAKSAARGKSSVDWFYGFKLHLVVNDEGELLACCLTPGNTDNRQPVRSLVENLWGKLFADKGYISQVLFETLFDQKLQLVTKLKRSIIETITDQLKNISQIEHTRQRSLWNFLCNVAVGLIAYTWQPNKPSLGLRPDDLPLPLLVC